MLIDTERLKVGDREAWRERERYDSVLSRSPRLARLEEQSVGLLQGWLGAHPDAFVSMSWGKDSVVVGHLASLAKPDVVLKRARVADWEPAETDWVRNKFLVDHPSVGYEEAVYDGRVPQRGEPGFEEVHSDPNRRATNIMKKLIPGRYVSGVRAEEARIRALSLRWHGESTEQTCRPIIRWSAVDVFAYLFREGLPVHPTYAMSYAGLLDRRWLRVHILGSTKAQRSAVYGRSMDEWEEDYYGDVLDGAREQRKGYWA